MRIMQGLSVSLSALRRNKLRSLLTVLGIIIGIAAVVAMVSVGGGLKYFVIAEFDRIGGATTIVLFRPGEIKSKDGKWVRNKTPERLEYQDISAISSFCPAIKNVSGIIGAGGKTVSYRGQNKSVEIEGVTPRYSEGRNWPVESGYFFKDQDLIENRMVCAIGSKVRQDVFGNVDPIGEVLRISDQRFTVVATMIEKGNKMATTNWDNRVLIPLTTMETRFTGKKNSGLIFWIQAIDIDLVDQAVAELKIALRRLHKSEEYFDFFIAQEIIKRVGSISKILQLLLAGVAGISLFVGGIGIMNIMLVSVTERTREIGLRKAVGAKGFDIRLQFLLESVLLSIIGGTIGILISSGLALGAALAVTKFLIKDAQWPASFSINAAVAAFLVSTIIGVTFGLYPAIKASRLQPTEALRYE